MKKILPKPILIVTSVIVLLIIAGCLLWSSHRQKAYLKAVQDASERIGFVALLSEFITSEYYNVWHGAIYDHKIEINGVTHYTSDFNDAISMRKDKIDYKILDAAIYSMDSAMKVTIKICPKKYNKLQSDLMQLYVVSSEYARLAKFPEGSLTTFSAKCSELGTEFMKKQKQISIQIP